MQSSIGALIAAARRRITQLVLEHAARHELTAQQFWLVLAIHETPGISQVEISDRTLADTASISRSLSSLSDRGMVEIATDPDDRRRSLVRLTPAGDHLAAELLPVARQLRDGLVNGMSPGEIRLLHGALERLIANLEGLDQCGAQRESA